LILIQILQKKGIKFRGRRRGYYIKKKNQKTENIEIPAVIQLGTGLLRTFAHVFLKLF
jgi:imidazole glycerol phosphate synthase subunit HisF